MLPPTVSPTPVSRRHLSESDLGGWCNSPLLHLAIGLSLVGVMLADILTPLGIAVWVLYLVPLTLSFAAWRPQTPFMVATAATALMVMTFLTDSGDFDRTIAQINRGFGILTQWIMAPVGYYFIKSRLAVHAQQWLQRGRAGLSEAMAGEQNPEEFGAAALKYLAEFLDAQAGAIYVEADGRYQRIATYGVPTDAPVPKFFTRGDGLLGQSVRDKRPFVVADVPHDYLWVGSALGRSRPQGVYIAPLLSEGIVNGVVELGFFNGLHDGVAEFLENVSESMAIAVRSGRYRMHLQDALEETQRQAEELQVQSEELRVSNEELEEQSRALQESQARLEQQQIELEQTNAQLEEQTQLLEAQRDDLAKSRVEVEAKAREVQRESRYKSDFLANMSHELRTPLNSSLILARLLADNTEGNLTEDQVNSASTILSAGNDLLALINDILDLSKIEAGRLDVRPQTIDVAEMVQRLTQTLRPLAEDKALQLQVTVAATAPGTIYSDRLRVEQVLKNLLSNAIKFTDTGTVTLGVEAAGDRIAITVEDTGIGIAEDKQNEIFQAFRQIDSAANRKFSGTGLGLSISQELARLLGGDLRVQSVIGVGSKFTLDLPQEYDAVSAPVPVLRDSPATIPYRPASSNGADSNGGPAPAPVPRRVIVADDRDKLRGDMRTILIVEDDASFARLMVDLAHELNFQCLVAMTAEEALVMAQQYRPGAVVLDVGLPDQSGLTVLDRLKHDSRTRHIPVHVVSASDYAETALSLGAVGYILKPVTRERLAEAIRGMEARLTQKVRRVLVVEDDAVQLDSLRKLLGTSDVQTEGARTAADCLAKLKESTFDCLVLDLSLPDASGHQLLETLSREEAYSFPPVIIYTGRDLSTEEEHDLRKYSKSIIIKGAKSPERLLDEVTLFLHQVVDELPAEQQRMIQEARSREAALEGRRILVVEDDVRNLFALSRVLEPKGAKVQIARNGLEALAQLEASTDDPANRIDLVLMDVMMPEMDGLTATREIRKRAEWRNLPIIVLTAKAMKDDQEECFAAGANDYLAKPLDVDKLLSLVRVWIRR